MNLEIQSGEPKSDGLYVVFVDCAMPKGWTEPHIVLRHKGQWLHRNSNSKYIDTVKAWITLPPLSDAMIEAMGAKVFDL